MTISKTKCRPIYLLYIYLAAWLVQISSNPSGVISHSFKYT
jgi:hypothetical protein